MEIHSHIVFIWVFTIIKAESKGGIVMYKIKNLRLAGIRAGISTEDVQFDENGIGVIQSLEIYQAVLELDNFTAVEEEDVPEVEPEDKVEEPSQEQTQEIKATAVRKSVTAK